MTTDAPTGRVRRRPAGRHRADGRRADHHVRPGIPRRCGTSSRQWLRSTLPEGNDAEVVELTSPESNGMSSETLLVTRPVGRGRCHGRAGAWWPGSSRRRPTTRSSPPTTSTCSSGSCGWCRSTPTCPSPRPTGTSPTRPSSAAPFFVMDRVDGLVPPDVLPYTFGDNWVFDGTDAARRTIQESAVRAMAGIHSIRPDDHDLSFLRARPAR